jgi:hypothetical protein
MGGACSSITYNELRILTTNHSNKRGAFEQKVRVVRVAT